MLLADRPADVHWRRSPRARRVSLKIDPASGGVIVTLPPRIAESAGRALLLSHAGWVAERLARLPPAMVLTDGAAIPIEGVPHPILLKPGRTRIEGGVLLVGGAPEFLTRRVTDFLRAEARRRLAARVADKVALGAPAPGRIVIKDTRSRWGSCTADGTLMFSWRLLMAPPIVGDYVVAHEMAHLRHMDHGRGFWALVAQLTPHREAATRWLEAEGAGLLRVG